MAKIIEVRVGRYRADYSVGKANPDADMEVSLRLPQYVQMDYHCCGFLAAKTVVQYFRPGIKDQDILAAVRPTVSIGTVREKMVRGMAHLNVSATYRDDLSIEDLRALVRVGIPVIVTVWPEGWPRDHWVVVDGFDHRGNIHLTNHRAMSLDCFHREWVECWGEEWTTGAGLICSV